MAYIPHTDAEREQMLNIIGAKSIDELFEAVPETHRFPALNLPPMMSEMDIVAEMQALSEANDHAGDFAIFRGAGAYHHFIPSVVNHILLRGEYFTAYTPYQPEVSQGTLQAIYEYQSMLAQLTGMDAANASHYDGATSLAEAVTVAKDVGRNKRKRIILSPYINPQYRAVVRTYHQWGDLEFVGDDQPYTTSELIDLIDENTAMIAVGYPNYLGHIENLSLFAEKAHEKGALLVVVANPIALAMFKSPGELGADLVVGEGQSLGIPLSFGGPYLGYFACREDYVRRIAGRIVGETVDQNGTRAYVMTLRPREQDIRREKASSNICTNQGLMALAATVYLSLMGKNGLRKAAELCYHKTQYAADRIDDLLHFSVDRLQPFFNEFVVKCPIPVSEINALLSERGILGGVDLSEDYPHLKDHMLICVTEMNRKSEIDSLVEVLKEVRHE
ncbi:MAG: aminomethyl-transferring glycine dehydrogenase subunit GcvPA [Anaerolineae bacterium]|nr:aminomethyl-transferring glycine dehydrogenase subunit GcvPA [Anaerolineae bacterium]